MKEMEIVKHNVKILVEKEPEVKECYNLLYTRYWQKFEYARELTDAKRCTPAETISRAFRSLVRSGDISISEVTRESRKNKRKEYHQYFSEEVHIING